MTDVTTKSVTKTADSIVSREVRGEDRELVKVPISSTSQDRDGDVFAEEALSGMAEQIRAEQPLVFQNHGFTAFDRPLYDQRDSIGTQVDAELDREKADDDGAELSALILPDTTHEEGQRLLSQVKAGQAVKFSVGFRVQDAEPLNPEAENDERRKFKEVDLMETSKVGIPSNPDATVTAAAKSAALADHLDASGVDIDDETAFARALAGELVGDATPPGDAVDAARSAAKVEGGCEGDAECPDGEVCVDGECVPEEDLNDADTEADSHMDEDELRDIIRDEIAAALDDERDAESDTDETDGAPAQTDDSDDLDALREEMAALRDALEGDVAADEATTETAPPEEGDEVEQNDTDEITVEERIHGNA